MTVFSNMKNLHFKNFRLHKFNKFSVIGMDTDALLHIARQCIIHYISNIIISQNSTGWISDRKHYVRWTQGLITMGHATYLRYDILILLYYYSLFSTTFINAFSPCRGILRGPCGAGGTAVIPLRPSRKTSEEASLTLWSPGPASSVPVPLVERSLRLSTTP